MNVLSIMHNQAPVSLLFALAIILAAPFAHADTGSACPFVWNTNLKTGSSGNDVLRLQQFLNTYPSTAIALSGTGSAGKESTLFGLLTKKAVIKFQEMYAADILLPSGLTSGTGIVGNFTRAKLNALCASGGNAQSSSQSAAVAFAVQGVDGLTVSDPGQSGSTLAPAGSGVLFLSFDLEASTKDVAVSNVAIERTGLGSNGSIASFGLYDENGLQIGPVSTLSSINTANFRKSFTIPAGQKRSFEVYANMSVDESAYDGQMPAIRLAGVTASSPISGTLPVQGEAQTVNSSLVVGGATALLSPDDPGAPISRYINDTGVKFAGIRITANSQEDLTLDAIVWTQSGSASRDDIRNVTVVVDEIEYQAMISPYNEREYVTFFDPGVLIKKGHTVNVYIKGDIAMMAANRTVEFDIYDINDDVSLTGIQYGFGVGLSPNGNTNVAGEHSAFITSDGTTDGDTGTPFFAGPVVTILGATMTGAYRY